MRRVRPSACFGPTRVVVGVHTVLNSAGRHLRLLPVIGNSSSPTPFAPDPQFASLFLHLFLPVVNCSRRSYSLLVCGRDIDAGSNKILYGLVLVVLGEGVDGYAIQRYVLRTQLALPHSAA